MTTVVQGVRSSLLPAASATCRPHRIGAGGVHRGTEVVWPHQDDGICLALNSAWEACQRLMFDALRDEPTRMAALTGMFAARLRESLTWRQQLHSDGPSYDDVDCDAVASAFIGALAASGRSCEALRYQLSYLVDVERMSEVEAAIDAAAGVVAQPPTQS